MPFVDDRLETLNMSTLSRSRLFSWSAFLLGLVLVAGCGATKHASTVTTSLPAAQRDASDDFFASPTITRIVLHLTNVEEQKLVGDARQYVRCTLIQDKARPLVNVGLKLKGAAGSFQELSGKPAFTINVNKFNKHQSFHELEKFHLNNSVQDELYTNEWLCSSIAREAGIPAPRVTHARVWLNDRDLGLYVLKEGFDNHFLKRCFRDPNGNLYDGGFCQDIDCELEKDAGKGPIDLSDLRALVEACSEADPERRRAQMEQQLNVEAFLKFMAFEMMTCHWDGYVANRNNYRIYFPTDSKRAQFLPHGMDQMFQDPGFQTFGYTPAIAASAIRSNEEWNAQFRQCVETLLPLFEGSRLSGQVKELHRKLRPTMMELNPNGIFEYDQQSAELQERLHLRYTSIVQHLSEPDPPLPDPSLEQEVALMVLEIGEVIALENWEPKQETEAARHARIEPSANAVDEEKRDVLYAIEAGDANDCIASWRSTVRLPDGNYRFIAQLRVKDVVPRQNDDRGIGAGLRISGNRRENALMDTSDWNETSYDFQIDEDQHSVQLIAELRATKGSMMMKNARLTRIGN